MGNTEDAASSSSMVVEMLVDTHCWLEEDEGESNDETDDLVSSVELINSLSQDDSESQTDDE